MIVAVTGANGFIGRHLCERLVANGHETRPVVRVDYEQKRLSESMAGVDVVIHAAGETRAATRERLRASIVALTRDTLAAATAAKVKRFVFVSSQAAAGPSPYRTTPTREDDPPGPIEEYGRSKLEAERLVRLASIPFTIVRPSAVYGPGDADFRAMFRLASLGLAVHPGNRSQWISIIHVRDCADAIVRAATHEAASGRTYFVANDEPVQWSTLFEKVRLAAGGSLIADVEVPKSLVGLAAKAGDVAAQLTGSASLLTTEKTRLGKPAFWICSNERAKAEIGFRQAIALDVGIAETLRWYRANGWM